MRKFLEILLSTAGILSAVWMTSGCGIEDGFDECLNAAEDMMADRPDSALTILEGIDTTISRSRSQNARYALLMSMALDKNYIDRTSDTLINIAVRHYRHRINSVYKFKSWYYQARIYQNAGKFDQAMESIVRAEHVNRRKLDKADLGRLMFIKADIYHERYDLNREKEALYQAADYSLQGEHINNYVKSQLRLGTVCLVQKNYAELDSCIAIIDRYQPIASNVRYGTADLKLLYSIKKDTCVSQINARIEDMISLADEDKDINWIILAQAYNKLGDDKSAAYALQKCKEYCDVSTDLTYWLLCSMVSYSEGDYKNAYDNMLKYSDLSDSLDLAHIKQEVRSVEERYENKILIIKQKTELLLLLLLCVLLGLGIFGIRKRRKREREYIRKYELLNTECEGLKSISDKYVILQKSSATERYKLEAYETASKILDNRVRALSSFLSKDIPDSLSLVADEMESLINDRDNVVDSIGMLYAIYRPIFVLKLKNYGLTSSEIGYCCLLVLGLRTSELSEVVHKSNTYNISSRLRSKLGLDRNSGMLSTWLKNLYTQTDREIHQVENFQEE